jgi:hypothetical protein
MSKPKQLRVTAAAAAALVLCAVEAWAWQQEKPKLGYTDTPFLPGNRWRVHDGQRPQPKIISPGTASTQDKPGAPPSDAVVLFDGKDLAHWRGSDQKPVARLEDGAMIIERDSPTSKEEFGDCQLHVEFATPDPPKGRDQGRGNSGVMIMGRYEIQVLDSFDNLTYPDGQAAAIYGQYPPLVNASRKPGEWQTYDIVFTAPRFKPDGTVETPAYVTMFHNGVLVHNHTALLGSVVFRDLARYTKHGPKGPIALQAHGNPVRYRNIWVREIKNYDEP